MGQAEISCDVTDLRRLGGALAGIGLPWVLTIFAMSGFWTDDVSIVPLLWFAPPFLLKRLLVAARLELPRRVVWWSALVAGASSWVVAVGASLSRARAVMNVAHSVGVAAGAVLFCVALLSLTDSLGWDAHVVRWRSALRTWLFSVAASVVGAALWAVGETMDPGRDVPWQFWGGVAALVSVVVFAVAAYRLAKVLPATRAGLLEIPDPQTHTPLFSTGPLS